MAKQSKTEDQLKAEIFGIYTRYTSESSSDRRQVDFVRIYDKIITWCKVFLRIEADEMGVEIYRVVQRLIKRSDKNIPKDENKFYSYLRVALTNARKEYHRNISIAQEDIPRDIKYKLKLVKDLIAYKESYAGKKLTETQRRQYISELFNPEEYSELLKFTNIGRLEFNSNSSDKDDTFDILNSEVKSIFVENDSLNPLDEYLTKLCDKGTSEIIENVLQGMQERSRECYRSLFTLYCINKSLLTEYLIPLLDNKILETYQENGKKPKRREIYLKYHPTVQKESAAARSAQMLKDFLDKLKIALENTEKFH